MTYTTPLCQELDDFILRMAPRHVAIDYAPGDLETLKAYVEKFPDAPLPVWNGASDLTIYGSPEVNWAARAWHDSVHLALSCKTDLPGERYVARFQWAEAKDAQLSYPAMAYLWIDNWGQQLYFAHYREFPTDQRAFAQQVWKLIPHVMASEALQIPRFHGACRDAIENAVWEFLNTGTKV